MSILIKSTLLFIKSLLSEPFFSNFEIFVTYLSAAKKKCDETFDFKFTCLPKI